MYSPTAAAGSANTSGPIDQDNERYELLLSILPNPTFAFSVAAWCPGHAYTCTHDGCLATCVVEATPPVSHRLSVKSLLGVARVVPGMPNDSKTSPFIYMNLCRGVAVEPAGAPRALSSAATHFLRQCLCPHHNRKNTLHHAKRCSIHQQVGPGQSG